MVKISLKCADRETHKALKTQTFTGNDHYAAFMSMADFLCKNPKRIGTKMDVTEEKDESNA